jgi:DNA-binding SARP family transcriptional activator
VATNVIAPERSATEVNPHPANLADAWRLRLFGCWTLVRAGYELNVRLREQRLIALIALQGSRPRTYLSGTLWPDCTEQRAAGSLRAAVWRIEQIAPGLLDFDRRHIGFAQNIATDVLDLAGFAARIDEPEGRDGAEPAGNVAAWARELSVLAAGDLLPGWYDDWVLFERARFQQLRLQALEAAVDRLLDRGDVSSALAAALTAVGIEPLHEGAQRALIRVHLAASNYSEALRAYHDLRHNMLRELGIAPSVHTEALVHHLVTGRLSRNSIDPSPSVRGY